MDHHVRLTRPYCVLCRYPSIPRDDESHIHEVDYFRAVQKTPSGHVGLTPSFQFPAYGRAYHGNWEFCCYQDCREFSESPEAFVFHTDCFQFLRQRLNGGVTLLDLLFQIWELGYWTQLPSKVSTAYSVPKIWLPDAFPKELESVEIHTDECSVFLKDVFTKLPLEVCQIIVQYCPFSPLWRYAAVMNCQSNTLTKLEDHDVLELSADDLLNWQRYSGTSESSLPKEHLKPDMSPSGRIRLTIDDHGFKKVEILSGGSAAINIPSSNSDTWYMVEDISWLSDFRILTRGGLLTLHPKKTHVKWNMWDTPIPPSFEHCFFCPHEPPLGMYRLRCVPFGDDLTGLTLFFDGITILEIHGHHSSDSGSLSVLDTYSRIPLRRRKHLLWLYFPLARGEKVDRIFLRHDGRREGNPTPVMMIRTSFDRSYAFGPYIQLPKAEYYEMTLSQGRINSLIYTVHNQWDVLEGRRPDLIGTSCQTKNDTQGQGPQLSFASTTVVARTSPRDLEGWLHYSEAPLSGVVKADLFHNDTGTLCIGMLLHYANGRKEALGQCRVGFSLPSAAPMSFHSPFFMYFKGITYRPGPHATQDSHGIQIRFSSLGQLGDPDGTSSDWLVEPMLGTIEWWFGHNETIVKFVNVPSDTRGPMQEGAEEGEE